MTQDLPAPWRDRALALTPAVVLLVLAALLSTLAAPSAAAASAPQVKAHAATAKHAGTAKLRDPRRNVDASPYYLDACAVHGPNAKSCLQRALSAINNARAAEGVRPMVLPKNYKKLSIARQTFVVTNLERVDRGLRPIKGLTKKLNASAHHAAKVRADPTLIGAVMALLGVRQYGSIWAGDYGPLASDFDWMYNDGYSPEGSVNLDCRTPSSRGCWGHRHVILDAYSGLRTLAGGVGAVGSLGGSIAQIFVGSVKRSFDYVYTWKQARAHGAGGHKVTAA
ncbi:MAG TPA: hypothetical protein VHE57_12250 [Mycobacteriales bacterium]|jgi:hypothetical protein|nr:hypothetical protein [Mycobacteriales bacterium]